MALVKLADGTLIHTSQLDQMTPRNENNYYETKIGDAIDEPPPVNPIPDRKDELQGDTIDIEEYIAMMNEAGALGISISSKNENVQVIKAENGFVINYYYNEYGPNVQKDEQRTVLVTDAQELGDTILELFDRKE